MTSVRICKECADPPKGKPRPAPFPGPRCATHHRVEKKRRARVMAGQRVHRTYGLTAVEYDMLYEAQGGRCAMPRCTATGKRRRLAVDHDHVTGEVRGLLCGPHNYELIGKFKNSLQDALDYLAKPPAKAMLKDYRAGKDVFGVSD